MISRCGSQGIFVTWCCDNDDGNDDNDGGRDGVRVLRLESSAWI